MNTPTEKDLKCLNKVADGVIELQNLHLKFGFVDGQYTIARGDYNSYLLAVPDDTPQEDNPYDLITGETVSQQFTGEDELVLFAEDALTLRKALRSTKGERIYLNIKPSKVIFTGTDVINFTVDEVEVSQNTINTITFWENFKLRIVKSQWMNVLGCMNGLVIVRAVIVRDNVRIVIKEADGKRLGIIMLMGQDIDQFIKFSRPLWLAITKAEFRDSNSVYSTLMHTEKRSMSEAINWEPYYHLTPEEAAREVMKRYTTRPETFKVAKVLEVYDEAFIFLRNGKARRYVVNQDRARKITHILSRWGYTRYPRYSYKLGKGKTTLLVSPDALDEYAKGKVK